MTFSKVEPNFNSASCLHDLAQNLGHSGSLYMLAEGANKGTKQTANTGGPCGGQPKRGEQMQSQAFRGVPQVPPYPLCSFSLTEGPTA